MDTINAFLNRIGRGVGGVVGALYQAGRESIDMVIRNEDLAHSAQIGGYVRSAGFVPVAPTPVGAAHWWIAKFNDHAEADMFMERMAHMTQEKPGSAILALLKRFSQARGRNEHIQTRVQIAMMVRAWNLDVERVYVHRLPSKSRTGEYTLPEVAKRVESQEDTYGPIAGREVPESDNIEGDEEDSA